MYKMCKSNVSDSRATTQQKGFQTEYLQTEYVKDDGYGRPGVLGEHV